MTVRSVQRLDSVHAGSFCHSNIGPYSVSPTSSFDQLPPRDLNNTHRNPVILFASPLRQYIGAHLYIYRSLTKYIPSNRHAGTHDAPSLAPMTLPLLGPRKRGSKQTSHLKSPANEDASSTSTTSRSRRQKPHGLGSSVDSLVEEFCSTAEQLCRGLPHPNRSISGSHRYYPHDLLRAHMNSAGRRSLKHLLKILCRAANLDRYDPETLVQTIIGVDAGSSMVRYFLAALKIPSMLNPHSKLWPTFLRQLVEENLHDVDFTEHNTGGRIKAFGYDGRNYASYHHLFWPLQLKEGEMIDQEARLMPIVRQEALGHAAKHYRVALCDGAIHGRSRSNSDFFLKKVSTSADCPGPPNEWTITEELMDNSMNKHIIVPIAGVKEDSHHYCLFSDWRGVSLTEFLRSEKFAPTEFHYWRDKVLPRLFLALADALEYCHSGLDGSVLIHGDLDPDNILLCQPDPERRPEHYFFAVIDFGSGRLVDKRTGATKTSHGSSILNCRPGTAPETRGGNPHTTASDVWSLGRIFDIVMKWFAQGPHGVTALAYSLDDEEYWTKTSSETVLHRAVKAHMDVAEHHIKKLPKKQQYIYMRLQRLIADHMLRIDPTERMDMTHIRDRLRDIFKSDQSLEPFDEQPQYTFAGKISTQKLLCH